MKMTIRFSCGRSRAIAGENSCETIAVVSWWFVAVLRQAADAAAAGSDIPRKDNRPNNDNNDSQQMDDRDSHAAHAAKAGGAGKSSS